MSAGSLTPQEAAEELVLRKGLFGADWEQPIEQVSLSRDLLVKSMVQAIELYESSRKRIQLTAEQAKAFDERVEVLQVEMDGYANAVGTREHFYPVFGRFQLEVNGYWFTPTAFRQLAAVCEALATNLERFPS